MSLNIRRIIAYLIDIFIVSIIAGALSVSPLNPDSNKLSNYRLELEEMREEYSELYKSIDIEDEEELDAIYNEFREIAIDYNYRIARNSIYEQIITIVCLILYYVLFAYYFESQTVGKRLMKLEIETKDGNKPSLVNLLIRMIMLFRIPITIITMILCFTLDKNTFYDVSAVLTVVTSAYNLSLIFMALGRKDRRGIHDLVAGTKVETIK